ncbi:MAG: hypothetical protein GX601_05620 [Anaerolineales bacterium]|nr:hypothetical protein [Anaerolineales bacterium]
MDYRILRLAGRCRSGVDRAGVVFHAVPKGSIVALCGREPGRRSAGWSTYEGSEVTCPRCRRKLEASDGPTAR